MNAADRRRMTPALVVVAALLALLLIALWIGLGRSPRWHDTLAPVQLPPREAAVPAPTVPPLAQFSDVWERPLFSPTRTPEVAAGGDQESSGDLQLTGVIMSPGMNMALLHDKTTGKDYRLIQGRPAHGAPTLLELHPRGAVVEASGSRLQLQLVPGPAPDSGDQAPAGDGQPVPAASAGGNASAMVTRRGEGDNGRAGMPANGPQSPEARARLLKARIEARRRRAQQDGGG